MSDSPFIQLGSNADLVSEIEAREKRAPMSEDLRVRLATLIGIARPSVQGALSGESNNGDQARTIESYQDVRKLTDLSQMLLLITLQSQLKRYPERRKIVEWDKIKTAKPKAMKSILEKAKVAEWDKVKEALEVNPRTLWSIQKMEESGGKPDIFRVDKEGFEIGDCVQEGPSVRRNIAYDNAAFLAEQWGVELMSDEQYRHLQTLGKFDELTECWLKTPSDMRGAGRANVGFIHPTSGVCVTPGDPLDALERRAFRCALRVEWVKEPEKISFVETVRQMIFPTGK